MPQQSADPHSGLSFLWALLGGAEAQVEGDLEGSVEDDLVFHGSDSNFRAAPPDLIANALIRSMLRPSFRPEAAPVAQAVGANEAADRVVPSENVRATEITPDIEAAIVLPVEPGTPLGEPTRSTDGAIETAKADNEPDSPQPAVALAEDFRPQVSPVEPAPISCISSDTPPEAPSASSIPAAPNGVESARPPAVVGNVAPATQTPETSLRDATHAAPKPDASGAGTERPGMQPLVRTSSTEPSSPLAFAMRLRELGDRTLSPPTSARPQGGDAPVPSKTAEAPVTTPVSTPDLTSKLPMDSTMTPAEPNGLSTPQPRPAAMSAKASAGSTSEIRPTVSQPAQLAAVAPASAANDAQSGGQGFEEGVTKPPRHDRAPAPAAATAAFEVSSASVDQRAASAPIHFSPAMQAPRGAAPAAKAPLTIPNPPLAEAPADAVTIARPTATPEIAVQLRAEGGASVDVLVAQRGGELRVAVRTPDPGLQQVLRDDLHSLVGQLEKSGFRTESIATNELRTEPASSTQANSIHFGPASGVPLRAEARADSGSGDQASPQSDSGARQQQQQQQYPRRQAPPAQWEQWLQNQARLNGGEESR